MNYIITKEKMSFQNLNQKISHAYTEQFYDLSYQIINQAAGKLELFAMHQEPNIRGHDKIQKAYFNALKELNENMNIFKEKVEEIILNSLERPPIREPEEKKKRVSNRYGFIIDEEEDETNSSNSIYQKENLKTLFSDNEKLEKKEREFTVKDPFLFKTVKEPFVFKNELNHDEKQRRLNDRGIFSEDVQERKIQMEKKPLYLMKRE